MRDYHNIEKSAFRRGEYIGYTTYKGRSGIVGIRRPSSGKGWETYLRAGFDNVPTLRQPTLAAMSDSLSDLSLTPKYPVKDKDFAQYNRVSVEDLEHDF